MKKLLILLLVFFKHLFPVYSQSHETIFLYLDTERNGSEAFVRVRAIHANDILAFQFGIDINPLEYKISEIKSYEYPASNVIGLPLFAFDSLSKTLRCIWNQLGGQNASIPDDQVLLEFKLTQLNPPADSCLKFSNNLVFVTEFLGNSGSYDVIVSNSCEKLSFGSISGEVLLDEDKNCQKDQIYHPLNNFTIVLESTTGDKFIAKTFNSKFVKSLLPGDYKVEVIPPVPVWQLCQYPSVITIPANREKITFEALSNSAIDCKQIEVNVLGDRLRLCAESIVFVNYANVGTVDVDNVSIELTLDNNLELTMCSYPYVSIGNNKFKIQVGQVKITESNSFFIGVKTPCDIGLLNQTACIEANSSPFEFCLPDPLWSGANLKITPRCLSSKVAFDVENNGIGDMKESINYNIVEDDLLPGSQGLIKLNKNEKKTIEYPANGRTIRIIVDTISNHPYHQKFTSAVEACRANMEKVSTGFVTQYSFEDDAPNVDLACYRLVASYDPNDKNATPVGITDMHFIEKNSRLQYLIRFQNTGTDTAYKVRIQDEISDKLDLQSLRIEGASHPFNTSLEDGRLLAFTFDKIYLPDSAADEKASHGYVQYSLVPDNKLKDGDIIENYADIHFDFNPPVRTNTFYHTIGRIATIVSDHPDRNTNVEYYPNPANGLVIFKLNNHSSNTYLYIFDLDGKVVKSQHASEAKVEVNLTELQQGFYTFKLESDGYLIDSGSLVIK